MTIGGVLAVLGAVNGWAVVGPIGLNFILFPFVSLAVTFGLAWIVAALLGVPFVHPPVCVAEATSEMMLLEFADAAYMEEFIALNEERCVDLDGDNED